MIVTSDNFPDGFVTRDTGSACDIHNTWLKVALVCGQRHEVLQRLDVIKLEIHSADGYAAIDRCAHVSSNYLRNLFWVVNMRDERPRRCMIKTAGTLFSGSFKAVHAQLQPT